eukprot:s1247_g5.t1
MAAVAMRPAMARPASGPLYVANERTTKPIQPVQAVQPVPMQATQPQAMWSSKKQEANRGLASRSRERPRS